MRITAKELKDAFYAECARASNLSLGRAFFNLRDVTLFINSAYMSCVNKRLGLIDSRFLPQDKRAMGQGANNQTPDSMRVLLDFGTLYKSKYLTALTGQARMHSVLPVETVGERALVFELANLGSNNETPYILNVTLTELSANKSEYGVNRNVSYLCKPVGVSDAPKYALMYQNNKYLPYVYYRLRPLTYQTVTTHTFSGNDYSDNVRIMGIELNTPPISQGDWNSTRWRLLVDYIEFPPKFETNLLTDDTAASAFILPVMFGYEIAMEAAKIAMESLGNQRASTLDKTVNDQMGG